MSVYLQQYYFSFIHLKKKIKVMTHTGYKHTQSISYISIGYYYTIRIFIELFTLNSQIKVHA